jgi:SAM-dependent methyltransferase
VPESPEAFGSFARAACLSDVADGSWQHLRTTFEEVPELYDRARPSYPPELFDDLAALAPLSDHRRIVEIGCGTGQATLELAQRGYQLTCVELGEHLAAAARRKVSTFAGVAVVNADFETWQPSESNFDAVVAFTAFHWIDPALRYPKSASLLRPGGMLGIVATQHVLPAGGDRFFADVQADYIAATDETDESPPPLPENVPDLGDEIGVSGLFGNVAVCRYLWDVSYTAGEYLALLDTYSGHRTLDASVRERLYERIRRRIDELPAGTVRKSYLATLNLARRL